MSVFCCRNGISASRLLSLVASLWVVMSALGSSSLTAQESFSAAGLRTVAKTPAVAFSQGQDGGARRLLPAMAPQALVGLVSDAFGVSRFEVVALDLPFAGGDRLSIELPINGAVQSLELTRHELRSSKFLVRAQLPDGSWQVVPVGASATYRGQVPSGFGVGSSAGVLLASLGPLGLRGEIHRPGETVLSLRPLASVVPGAGRELHVLFEGRARELFPACGEGQGHPALPATVPTGAPPSPGPGLSSTGLTGVAGVGGKGPGPCLSLAEIAFEADFEYFQLHGSSVPAVVAQIESHLNLVDFFYARDTSITYELTQVLVRTAPFYTPVDGGDLLDQFRDEWNTNQAAVPRDLAHLMTAKPGSVIQYGGLAWVGVVCNLNLAYGWSLDSAGIVGHEVGHNWNAPHCLDPTPCNAMCGACLNHGPNTKAVIEAWRDAASCLDAKIFYPQPLPPYVLGEALSLDKSQYQTALPASFDVLANDDDGNCDELYVQSFDGLSEQGGAVSLTAGADGADLLLYTPPADLFVGSDSFDYVVGDGSPASTVGRVDIDVKPLRMLGWWSFDDGIGTTAADLADGQLHGAVNGPTWTLGVNGGALAFDGIDDEVVLPAMNSSAESMTLTAWFRRDGSQLNGAGLIVSRDAGTQSGLYFGAFNELRYTWASSLPTLLFNPGFTVPDDTWVFAALVVEPTKATVYFGDGVTLQSSVNAVTHLPQTFAGETKLGVDPVGLPRHFAGEMDTVRLWDHALSATDIDALWRHGGRAELPSPADGGLAPDAQAALRWQPGLDADAHDVYLGTDYQAVRDATPSSPEYEGNVLTPLYVTSPLSQGSTWYWRVDEVVGPDVVPGDVWQFRLADTGHWPLDDLAGTTAADVQGNVPGTYIGGPTLAKAGATPFTGTSVRLHGPGDGVLLPPLELQSDTVTLTLWVRRIGDQGAFTGLLFSRDANTVAGLNFGNLNELRYHWNGDGSTWGFDSQLVVPDATWTFCALVVRPDRADLYMGVNGAPLVSATNVVTHGPEEWDGQAWLGQDPTGGRWFNGRLDEPRVFDRALTTKELQQLYDDALNGLP